MITLYTSVGHYRLVPGKNDVSYPVITANGKEHRLDTKELLLWSSLMWSLLTYDELKNLYGEKEAELHLMDEQDFERYLKRLIFRGLVASGCGYTGLEALSDLLGHLYIKPITGGILAKVSAFFHLLKNQPFRMAVQIFKKEKLNSSEKSVFQLSRNRHLSPAELIRRIETKEITFPDGSSDYQQDVITAVANLYLKRLIIFDCI